MTLPHALGAGIVLGGHSDTGGFSKAGSRTPTDWPHVLRPQKIRPMDGPTLLIQSSGLKGWTPHSCHATMHAPPELGNYLELKQIQRTCLTAPLRWTRKYCWDKYSGSLRHQYVRICSIHDFMIFMECAKRAVSGITAKMCSPWFCMELPEKKWRNKQRNN